jgi:hypothetical protein
MAYTEMLLRAYGRKMADPSGVIAAFETLVRDPRAAQEATLRGILRRHGASEYGRRFGFAGIRHYDDYRAQVPVATYDELLPFITRMMAGEADVLVCGAVSYFSTTSGSTAAPKFIPGTQQTIAAGCDATAVRNAYLRRDHPDAFAGRPLLIVGSATEGKTTGGATYGAMTGFGYYVGQMGFPGPPLPYQIFTIPDYGCRYYCILRFALAARDLSAILVYNASTLLRLIDTASGSWDRLMADIAGGHLSPPAALPGELRVQLERALAPDLERAHELEGMLEAGPRGWWPNLGALLCWKGGTAGFYLGELRSRLGDLPIRDLGILASEVFLAVPVDDDTAGGVLLPDSGFFEFVPSGAGNEEARGAWELEEGAEYRVLVTTHGGLYRYDLADVVQVEGWHGGMPLLAFRHRSGRVYSFTGEKLTEHQVTEAVRGAADAEGIRLAGFVAVPTWSRPPYYEVRAELVSRADRGSCRRFARRIDTELKSANVEYKSKRASGRLAPVRLALVAPGLFDRVRRDGSAHDAQYKETHLASDPACQPDLEIIERVS